MAEQKRFASLQHLSTLSECHEANYKASISEVQYPLKCRKSGI